LTHSPFTINCQHNILISDEGNACLTDFGLSCSVDVTLGTHTSRPGGTIRWMAPELHEPERFGFPILQRTTESDIYALGCVFLEVGIHTSFVCYIDVHHSARSLHGCPHSQILKESLLLFERSWRANDQIDHPMKQCLMACGYLSRTPGSSNLLIGRKWRI
jgi:serine/threonine protein kinase